MKREEKNRQTRRRILDGALSEFSARGYEGGSINTICAGQNLSKGIVYHYFDTKDDLYLASVEECFERLTHWLEGIVPQPGADAEQQLKEYFVRRMAFFREYPVYQPIFCEAVISPPNHLRDQVRDRKQGFDDLNRKILAALLRLLPLRSSITQEEVVDTFRQFQDFINAKYQMADISNREFELREESCYKALQILLYGVVERKEDKYV